MQISQTVRGFLRSLELEGKGNMQLAHNVIMLERAMNIHLAMRGS